ALFQIETESIMRPTFQTSTGGKNARLAIVNLGRACVTAAVLTLATFAPGVRAQAAGLGSDESAPVVSHNRFLIVVDTSSGMKKFANDTRQAVENFIRSAADGQLHAGDSIGVWTYNKDVYTGRMPLQTWSLGDAEEIAMR